MKSLLGALLLSIISVTAFAAPSEDDKLASDIAAMVATQAYCALSYDEAGLNEYLNQNVRSSAADFHQTFNFVKNLLNNRIGEYEASKARGEDVTEYEENMVTLCAELKQKATLYGFLD